MAKRSARQVPDLGTSMTPVPIWGTATEARLPYVLDQWSGLPQYRCPHCPFDSLDEGTILEHIAAHLVAEKPQTLVQAFDARGNPL